MPEDQEPKIIVDSDWKSQAQAEKARLAEDEKNADPAPEGEPAEASFAELLRSIAMPALMYMGQIPDPGTGKAIVALDAAKLHIDMLGILEEKTKGNLTQDEQTELSGFLRELRMIFVEISSAVAKAVEQGKINPMDPAGAKPPATT